MNEVRRTKLTKRTVDALSVGPAPYILWDNELPGFGVRVSAGRKTYLIKYREQRRRNGRQRMPSVGRHGVVTCGEARVIARRWLAKVAAGEDPLGPQAQSVTFDEVAEDFYQNHALVKKKASSAALDRFLIDDFIKPQLGAISGERLTRKDVEKLHRAMQKTPTQANRMLSAVSAIFTHGQRADLIKSDLPNPVTGIQKYKEASRERFLSEAEIARLFEVLDAHHWNSPIFADAVRLALLTGLRKSSFLSLQWSFIDLANKALRLPDSKAGQLALPLSDAACSLLESIHVRSGDGKYVFPAATGEGHAVGLRKFWLKIRAEAGLEDVRIHDLRHSFASVAASSGTPLLVIGKLLGHKSPNMTQRYAHLSDDAVRTAVNAVGGKLTGN